jgi:TatD DNase family protein
MSLRLFDTHCHLTWHADEDPVAQRLERAREVGVQSFMTVGVDVESSRQCLDLSQRFDGVLASVGIHPNDCGTAPEFEQHFSEINQLADAGGFHAIGETGLDFFREWCAPEVQIKGFESHLQLAARLDLPVIIHCREAGQAVLEVLQNQNRSVAGIMHCFAEGPDMVQAFLDLGLHISFAGNMTYPKSQHLRDAAKIVPIDRILVETDAPFLAPQPKRGKRNEPAYVAYTLERLAEVKEVAAADLAEQTYHNAAQLFGLNAI